MKKALSILLVLTLLCSLMLPAASAAGSASVSVSGGSGLPGEEVSVSVSLDGLSEGFVSCTLSLAYDSALTLVSLDDASSADLAFGNASSGMISFASTSPVTSGSLATATFRIADNAASGNYFVSASVSGLRNDAGESISVSDGSGSVTVLHQHSAADAQWSSDETSHWHLCSCGQKVDVGSHTYDNIADTDCNTCGYVRPAHVHTYADKYSFDSQNHWFAPTCGCSDAPIVKEGHVPGAAATETTNQTCTVCGYIMQYATGSAAEQYLITVRKSENGTVKSGTPLAYAGETVTLTAAPAAGYKLKTLEVKNEAGEAYKLTATLKGHTFVMPECDVYVTAVFEKAPSSNPFSDVNSGDYFYNAVLWAVKNNVTSGTSASSFSPTASCTRAQFVTFLWRAAGCPDANTTASFADVAGNAYYAKAVNWAVEKGITTGTGANTFSPDALVTRAQAVTFLWRYAGSSSGNAASAFADIASNAYYAEAVNWAVEKGITTGTGANTFSPNADCTRAQVVTFLWRLFA